MVDEKRRQQLREAQRRWRKAHPEEAQANTIAWQQRPDVKARKAEKMREYRARLKAEGVQPTPEQRAAHVKRQQAYALRKKRGIPPKS